MPGAEGAPPALRALPRFPFMPLNQPRPTPDPGGEHGSEAALPGPAGPRPPRLSPESLRKPCASASEDAGPGAPGQGRPAAAWVRPVFITRSPSTSPPDRQRAGAPTAGCPLSLCLHQADLHSFGGLRTAAASPNVLPVKGHSSDSPVQRSRAPLSPRDPLFCVY